MTAPPPPGEGTNHIGLQEKAGTEEKKDKMGRYKNTVSHGLFSIHGNGVLIKRMLRWLIRLSQVWVSELVRVSS